MRKTFAIAVFYMYMTAAALLIEVTGVAAAWGVESPTGVSNAGAQAIAEFQNIQASGGLADTLFGSFVAAGNAVEALARTIFALPLFLSSMGVPDPFVAFLFAPAPLIVGRGILHALTGRFNA